MSNQADKNRILLYRAIDFGQLTEVQRLIEEEKVDINVLNQDMNTPLIYSLQLGQCHISRWLIDHGADPLYVSKNQTGVTALHLAVNTGDSYLVEKCLEAGADPNLQMKICGETPLHRTVKYQARFAQMLLEYGANPNIKNNKGETALGIERIRGPIEVELHKLIKSYDGYFVLHQDEKGESDLRRDIDQTASLSPHMFDMRQIEKYMSGRIEFPEVTKDDMSDDFNGRAQRASLVQKAIRGKLFEKFPDNAKWADFTTSNKYGVSALDVIKRRGELGDLLDQKPFWLKNPQAFQRFWDKDLKLWQRQNLQEKKSTLDVAMSLQKNVSRPLKRRSKR